MNNNSFLKAFFIIAFIALNTQAQVKTPKDSISNTLKSTGNISYEQGKEYILGDISVSGVQQFSEETVKVYTGLTNGSSLKLPGDKLTSAIKKLYESKQFSQVDVYLSKIDGNTVYLLFDVTELPQLNRVKITGIKNSKIDDIKKEAELKTGAQVTENLIITTRNYIKKKYTDKGFLKTKVTLNTRIDSSDLNSVDMSIFIDKGKRVKVKEINFHGNKAISSKKLRSKMKKTKRKFTGRFWKTSKYIQDNYQLDLENILSLYNELGYRDARILNDKLSWNDNNTVNIDIDLEEGRQYRFDEILFIGNKKYTDEYLNRLLKLAKGDVYNGKLLNERVKGDGSPDSQNIETLYQNNGFLFSSVNAIETKVKNDSITVEIRIREDEQATIRKVTVVGNDKTNDHVLFRELRVKPGDLFSRENIIRSIREIGQLGFFDANVTPDVRPDYQNKTADIEFGVVEKGGSQIELQGGYGGGSFIGTLGLSFNNFSLRNIFKKDAYKPLPMGDGQSVALRLQTSRNTNSYSLSFREPWLGGKKPQSLSVSFSLSEQFQILSNGDVDKNQSLTILGASVGLGKRLKWPDDFFSLSQSISYQQIKVNGFQYNVGSDRDLLLTRGTLNNLAYTFAFSRNSAGPSLIFPTYGSDISFRLKATLPYSFLGNKDNSESSDGLTGEDLEDFIAKKFKWLEYYKVSVKAKWYTELAKKLVLMTNFELGYLGTYDKDLGITPVERFFVGGDGLGQGNLDGRETIGLRGYENNAVSDTEGGSLYDKFQLEVRYSITDSPSASIYTLGFLEAGNSYNDIKAFNPFELKRSAGVGIRIFMPAFGLLGLDYAYGFDALNGSTTRSGWRPHFIIGRQF